MTEEERAAIASLGLEDTSESTLIHEVPIDSKPQEKKWAKCSGPPKPINRDGMGRYKIPPGGKPLTVRDIPGPGPTSYSPNCEYVAKKNPTWTFREGYDKPLKKEVPGPNTYNTSGDLNWGKCKKITLKSRLKSVDSKRGFPGPGTYDIVRTVSSAPKFTMRLKPKSELSPGLYSALAFLPDPDIPGPDYNIPSSDWLQKPQSFGYKYQEKKKIFGPGPQKYLLRGKPQGPKWSLGAVKKVPLKSKPAPGPQAYTIKSTIGEAPKFTMGSLLPRCQTKFITPGPDVYNSAGIRLDEPGYTMKYRWFDSVPEKRPGPYVYSDEKIRKQAPAYSMSIKGKLTYPSCVYSNFREEGPGPTQYNVPRDPLDQGKTFPIKIKDKTSPEVPGPADYQNVELTKTRLARAPAYSMGIQWKKTAEKRPGPNHYKVRYDIPDTGKTFGIKPQITEKKDETQCTFDPMDRSRLCRPCEFALGASLKSRHTPHKYLGLKDSSVIPPVPKDFPTAPLLG